jgi:hypothetical protein
MATKRQRSNGPPLWLQAFDPSQIDPVAALVREAFCDVAEGRGSRLHVPLTALLVAPVRAYVSAHDEGRPQSHVTAARALVEVAVGIARDLQAGCCLDAVAAATRAAALRTAWLEFIAYGAGHHLYHAKSHEWQLLSSIATRPRGRAKVLTPEVLARLMMAESLTSLSDEKAMAIAATYRVGLRTVYRRLAAARAVGLF